MKKLARRQVERSLAGTINFKEVDRDARSKVDDSRAVVVNGEVMGDVAMSDGLREPKEHSVDHEDASGTSDSEEDDKDEDVGNVAETKPTSDHEMADADVETQQADGTEGEQTFGDLIAATALAPVDVEASLEQLPDHSTSLAAAPSQSIQIPSATSLGTVLTQALRTNDAKLLESCLHVSDTLAIRSTIQRLDSSLATSLLSKLAERMHLRPHRAGHMMIWIQWTLVSHGGYLAGQPELMRRLSALHKVLRERANSLQPLLALKGKLDMLEAQMELRRSLKGFANGSDLREQEEDVEDERVIYVEGQQETDSEDDRETANAGPIVDMADFSIDGDHDDDEDEDEDEEMPTVNGVVADSVESSDVSLSADEDLVDDEAEETDADTGDEAEDDEDEDEDDGPDAFASVDEDRKVKLTGETLSKRPKKRRR